MGKKGKKRVAQAKRSNSGSGDKESVAKEAVAQEAAGDDAAVSTDQVEVDDSPRATTAEEGGPGPVFPPGLQANLSILSQEEQKLATLLLENGQEHLFAGWSAAGKDDTDKHAFFDQVKRLHESYPAPGGLAAYVTRAKALLAESKEGKNPLEGWTPSVPQGEILEPGTARYGELEALGEPEIASTAFVLVAGGLGERLGYSGIKVALPTETTTGLCYINYYLNYFSSVQARYSCKVQLAIMVSDDTHDRTVALLEAHDYFGFPRDQLTIMKQEKVAAISDNEARLALVEGSAYKLDCKPHGHGDVHSLLYSTGVARSWLQQGKRWVVFFQDTNALAFYTLPAALGVSKSLDLEVNSMAIPRFPKQAIGAIAKLQHVDGRVMIVNVEYNQLDPLLREAVNPEGDVADSTGFSPFPGNINQLLFRLEPYVKTLEASHGIMGEFVNPKYADSAKTVFKKPTRLECMMQDYPKVLGPTARVGFTSAPAWIAFSPVKNNITDAAKAALGGTPPGSASSGEADQYFVCAELLRLAGARVETVGAPQDWGGIKVSLTPNIVLDPSFCKDLRELRSKLPTPANVSISARSTLVIKGSGVVIESLNLDGALTVVAPECTKVIIRGAVVRNEGTRFVPLGADQGDEVLRMRGYRIMRDETAELVAPPDGQTYILGKDLKLKTPQQLADSEAGPETKPPDEAKALPASAGAAAPVPAEGESKQQQPTPGTTAGATSSGTPPPQWDASHGVEDPHQHTCWTKLTACFK